MKEKQVDGLVQEEKKVSLETQTITIDTSMQPTDDLSGEIPHPERLSLPHVFSSEQQTSATDNQIMQGTSPSHLLHPQSFIPQPTDPVLPGIGTQRPGEHIPLMPALVLPNAHRGMAPTHANGYQRPSIPIQGMPGQMMIATGGNNGGKRKIHLRLLEDPPERSGKRVSFLGFRRKKKRGNLLTTPKGKEPPDEDENKDESIDRGRVTVSWYEGTVSLELCEHVQNSVMRKLGLQNTNKISDLRILDEGMDPPEGKEPYVHLAAVFNAYNY